MPFLHRHGFRSVIWLGACALALSVATPHALAAVRYVNAGLTTGANNGSSWADAYRGAAALTIGLAASSSGDELWVAAGTYLPSVTGVRTAAITLKSGVAVYGGFAGTEATVAERNWTTNVTVISGDLGGNDGSGTLTDNSYHVLIGTGVTSAGVLDGFTIRGGNANGSSASFQDRGGGLYITSGNPTFRNCIFSGHRCTFGGGAAYVSPGGATFADCQFLNNIGGSFGGAFDTNAAVTKFDRCFFQGNTAARAGALESFGGASMTLTNCVFVGNTATGSNGGGALWMGSNGTVTARNCTFYANSATTLAGCIRNTGGTSTLGNCILWANTGPGGAVVANQISNNGGTTTATYCVVQGTYAGTGNTAADPLFVNAPGGDLRLQSTSAAIDAGSNALVPAGTTTDFAGLPRFVDLPSVADTGSGSAPLVDRGAHETVVPPPPCPADLTGDGTVDGADLGTLLGQFNSTGSADLNNDGTVDGADLGMLLGEWGSCS